MANPCKDFWDELWKWEKGKLHPGEKITDPYLALSLAQEKRNARKKLEKAKAAKKSDTKKEEKKLKDVCNRFEKVGRRFGKKLEKLLPKKGGKIDWKEFRRWVLFGLDPKIAGGSGNKPTISRGGDLMRIQVLVCALIAASLALILTLASVNADSNSFRYVDESDRLPPDFNQPDTDTLDVDFADVDDDGDLDIFVVDGTASVETRPNKLYINDGDGNFTDETFIRLPGSPPANSTEVDFADVDGDDDLDAIIANLGPNQLLLNDGIGFFIDASLTHLPPPNPNVLEDISAEARFADVDVDEDPDILVSNENPFNPDPLGGAQNRVLINDGTGHFTDETAARIPALTDQSQGFVGGDIDDDGDLDLIVVNIGQDLVLINDDTGHFSDETASRFPTTADSTRKGVLADFDGDGCLDLFMGNSRNQQNLLYLNDCSGAFVDVTDGNVPERADTTTDVDVVDLDDDGDLDLYITNAGDFLFGHGFLGDENVYLRNNGHGKFQDKSRVHFPEVSDPSTNAEFGDVDVDEDLDILIGNSTSIGGEETLYIRQRCPGKGQNCQ